MSLDTIAINSSVLLPGLKPNYYFMNTGVTNTFCFIETLTLCMDRN